MMNHVERTARLARTAEGVSASSGAAKTLRDEFAMEAIKCVGFLQPIQSADDVATQAYEIADAMMKAREEK